MMTWKQLLQEKLDEAAPPKDVYFVHQYFGEKRLYTNDPAFIKLLYKVAKEEIEDTFAGIEIVFSKHPTGPEDSNFDHELDNLIKNFIDMSVGRWQHYVSEHLSGGDWWKTDQLASPRGDDEPSPQQLHSISELRRAAEKANHFAIIYLEGQSNTPALVNFYVSTHTSVARQPFFRFDSFLEALRFLDKKPSWFGKKKVFLQGYKEGEPRPEWQLFTSEWLTRNLRRYAGKT